jgi:hypothetical protein
MVPSLSQVKKKAKKKREKETKALPLVLYHE